MNFEAQVRYEAEGAAAALRGVSRDLCPYPHRSPEWNHWVFGHDIALSEKQTFESGTVSWYSTSTDLTQPVAVQSVADAIRDGTWTPRFYKPPDCTALPTSSGKKP